MYVVFGERGEHQRQDVSCKRLWPIDWIKLFRSSSDFGPVPSQFAPRINGQLSRAPPLARSRLKAAERPRSALGDDATDQLVNQLTGLRLEWL